MAVDLSFLWHFSADCLEEGIVSTPDLDVIGGRPVEGQGPSENRNPARPDDLVGPDDADLDPAMGCAPNGAFFSTRQRCMASSRLIAQTGRHDTFVAKLDAARGARRFGDPLEAEAARLRFARAGVEGHGGLHDGDVGLSFRGISDG